jgi:hypothetical protein
VDIVFDPEKDAINRERHEGLSLDLARFFDWQAGVVGPARTVSGEVRWQLLAAYDGVVYSTIFVRRAGTARVISLRRASRKEREQYAKEARRG